MFRSFDENEFWKAINNKNYLRLKINTVSTMLSDPTFERGETDRVLKILEERVPEIFEDEKKLAFEKRLAPDLWDKGYFTELTYYFRENFAKSRIPYIKEVGRAVHQDTAKVYTESLKIGTDKKTSKGRNSENPPHAPGRREQSTMIGVVVTVGVLVLFLVLLVKMMIK